MSVKKRTARAVARFHDSDTFLVMAVDGNEIYSTWTDEESVCFGIAALIRKEPRFKNMIQFALTSERESRPQ